jgi:hypothetical protein
MVERNGFRIGLRGGFILCSRNSYLWTSVAIFAQAGSSSTHSQALPVMSHTVPVTCGMWPQWEAWLNMRALSTSGLHLYVTIRDDDNTFYIALVVTSLHCKATGVHMKLLDSHITIGSYRMVPDPSRKRVRDLVKCQRLRDQLIIKSQERVTAWIKPRWSGLARAVPIKLLAKGSGSDPAIFDLLLAEEANSVDKLVVAIENVFSGPFIATHEQGRRSMLYLPGPTLHLSIYGAMQINIPESESSEKKS